MTDKSKSDPTKDLEFQKVVRRFLKTPPKPHKPKKPDGPRANAGAGKGKK